MSLLARIKVAAEFRVGESPEGGIDINRYTADGYHLDNVMHDKLWFLHTCPPNSGHGLDFCQGSFLSSPYDWSTRGNEECPHFSIEYIKNGKPVKVRIPITSCYADESEYQKRISR